MLVNLYLFHLTLCLVVSPLRYIRNFIFQILFSSNSAKGDIYKYELFVCIYICNS